MSRYTTNSESQRTRELAEEYRSHGYEVVIEPAHDDLPEFLQGYRPDLLARKGDDNVIIEVTTRAEVSGEPELRDLAQVVREHGGWRLELVLVGSDDEDRADPDMSSLNEGDIADTMREAEVLIEQNHSDAALLLAWSTAEAAMRLLADKEEITLKRRDPLYVLKQLATYAVISKDEYIALLDVMSQRDALAHGFKTDRSSKDSVLKLLRMTNQMLGTSPNA
jgi:hypothetical protein